jgi:hypothetical protein
MADYAISNVPRRVVYAASGVGPYAFTFEILDVTDISVYRGSTLLTLTTDYTVTINANGTGSVTLVTTAGTSNVTIVGAKNIQRTSDFTTGGDLFANTLNDELDNQTIFVQQVAETAERGLKAPVTDPTDIAMTLPAKDGRKGKVLAFDSTTGNPVAGPSLDSLVTVIEQSAYINAVGENIDDVIAVADNEANIDTVAGVSSAVTTVATNISNVNTVADDLNEPTSEIHVVGTNITNVNTVGTNIASVNTVAGNNSNVTTVAGISANVTTVAGISSAVSNVSSISSAVTGVNSNSSNINTVAGQITPTNNVSTVAGISANVSTVAGISANVTTVATNNTNVSTVATNIANVNSVGGNIANVNSVAGNATNINAVNANATNINTVAGINANVTTVATNNANVTTVATNIASVNSVAGNASNINQVASDTTAINAASANATTATTKAAEALASANAASASAAAASAVALGSEPVRHSVRPSLLLDFANTKTLDPRITFTRASTGTFYDGKTVAKAEENLLLNSENFGGSGWQTSNVTTSLNVGASPDGTTTADKIIPNTTSAPHSLFQASITVTGDNVQSVYVKADGYSKVALRESEAGGYHAAFDLSAGTVLATSGCTATITSVGNSWYRIAMVGNRTGLTRWSIYVLDPSYTSGGILGSWAGDGTSGVLLWGAQVEQRSSVTAYTATTTAPITNYIPALQTAASGVARFEHNPVTGESLGLEIEEQRTNLFTYSSEFDNAAWGKTNASITANTIVAPDGALSGDKLVETTASGSHNLEIPSSPLTVTSGIAYTFSVYAKAAERTLLRLYDDSNSSQYTAVFNLSSGTTSDVGSLTTASITLVGNGWYRCSVTYTTASTLLRGRIGIVSGGSSNYTGNGFSGIYIWGAQLEAGSFATSYIPTVASQVTRSADSASMTGTNFSSWYRGDAGTIYAETQASAITSGYQYAMTSGTSTASGAGLFYDSASSRFSYRFWDAGGTAIGVISYTNAGSPNATTSYKTTFAFSTNDFAGSINGNVVTTDTSGVINGIADNLKIGASNNNTSLMNGTIKKFAYYPRRLTNSELQGLTTV